MLDHKNHIQENKYSKWYFSIIEKAQSRVSEGYIEKHHILPKSIYPEYRDFKEHPWNCVSLTAKEHFVVHLLLTKMFKTKKHTQLMLHASFNMICRSGRKFTSKLYSSVRESIVFTEEHRRKIAEANRGRKHSQETRDKMSQSAKGRVFTEEWSKNKSKAQVGSNNHQFGRVWTEEDRKMMSNLTSGELNGFYGKTHTQETKEKINFKVTCPHCGKEGNNAPMNRWHFTNCKNKGGSKSP